MKQSSSGFHNDHSELRDEIVQVGYVEEECLEIFDLIQGFHSAEGFSCWITDRNFKKFIHKNKIIDGKYNREWVYTLEKKTFFFGKVELEENQIPEDIKSQLLCLNSNFKEVEQLLEIKKVRIHSLLTERHYTVISHVIHNDLIIGKIWKIFHLPILLDIYKKKRDPLRYYRKTRTT